MNMLNSLAVTDIADVITVYSPKGRFEKMTDREYYGLSFCSEGQITYTHNGKEFVSDNKHVIFLPKARSYTLRGDKTGLFALINFNCARPLCDTFTLFPSESIKLLTSHFETMKKLVLLPESHARLMSIFYEMIHIISSESALCKTIAPAIQYIEKNYRDPELSNEALARECNISEVYLRKLFEKHLKTSPGRYIAELRLQKAKQLLSEGIYKVNSVSRECGFGSSYNFCRFFKSRTGLSPTEYMNANNISKI